MSRRALRAGAVAALLGLATVPASRDAFAADPPRYPAGAATFQANCAVCHGAAGVGTPALAPPLTAYPARYASTLEGRRQLAMTVLYGLFGDVVVEQKHYSFKMPEFPQLDDNTLATVLNYLIFDLGHAPESVQPLRADELAAERSHPVEGAAVYAHRAIVLRELGL